MKYKKPPLYGVAMYKLAWTYFKQQRYETAVREFVELLNYTDEQEKPTGDPGTDFRAEAYTYIAGSLTYLDFAGPAADDPYIAAQRRARHRVEPDGRRAEDARRHRSRAGPEAHPARQEVDGRGLQGARAGVPRGQPVPQRDRGERAHPREVADEPRRAGHPEPDRRHLRRADAHVAEGSPERDQNAARALEARTKLAAYVGNTPWVEANKDDPEAIQTAERLVRGGLRRAAADHTNLARAYVGKATETTDAAQQKIWLERALTEYKLADVGWSGLLAQDENAPDAYESRFWLADARHGVVVVTVNLDRSPVSRRRSTTRARPPSTCATRTRTTSSSSRRRITSSTSPSNRSRINTGSTRAPAARRASRSAPRCASQRG